MVYLSSSWTANPSICIYLYIYILCTIVSHINCFSCNCCSCGDRGGGCGGFVPPPSFPLRGWCTVGLWQGNVDHDWLRLSYLLLPSNCCKTYSSTSMMHWKYTRDLEAQVDLVIRGRRNPDTNQQVFNAEGPGPTSMWIYLARSKGR